MTDADFQDAIKACQTAEGLCIFLFDMNLGTVALTRQHCEITEWPKQDNETDADCQVRLESLKTEVEELISHYSEHGGLPDGR